MLKRFEWKENIWIGGSDDFPKYRQETWTGELLQFVECNGLMGAMLLADGSIHLVDFNDLKLAGL